ncbi:hypothetical protein [Pedococcus sp. 5OH_020]|uniref:hypothetical protein n=1 Tax=Pedococcus sp. 5OH_020 TaxID=2989814 RepID=UPI0022E9C740|nr:hypothetical protein [Pedococcus sp. 5OH_020]
MKRRHHPHQRDAFHTDVLSSLTRSTGNGATARFMAHIAFNEAGDQGQVGTSPDAVTDDEYNTAEPRGSDAHA